LRGFAVADPDGHIVLFAHPKAPGIDQPSLAARQAATGMGWIAGSWIWVEAVGSAIAALP
jgi:hypothetical protein